MAMPEQDHSELPQTGFEMSSGFNRRVSRRGFLRMGAGAGMAAAIAAVGIDCGPGGQPNQASNGKVDAAPTITPSPEPTATPEVKWDPDSLRELADKIGFKQGVQGAYGYLKDHGASYKNLPQQFNRLVIGDFLMTNPFNPPLMPSINTFNFATTDFTVNFAKANGMDIHGQHLTWGTSADQFKPKWVKDINSRDEAINALTTYIKGVVGKYPNINVWTVLNEVFSHGKPDLWGDKIGQDYPFIAARAAKETNPNAVYILNDYDNHIINQYSNANYDLVKKLTAEGLIDGIGFQMHLNGTNAPKKDDVKRNLDRFKQLNNGQFNLYVTEFDVNLQNVQGSQEERWAKEAQIYKDMMEALLEEGGQGFAIFGNNDKLSWLNDIGYPNSEGTPFDRDFNPKPAFFAMQDVLKNAANSKQISSQSR